jgi:hypothetical protein
MFCVFFSLSTVNRDCIYLNTLQHLQILLNLILKSYYLYHYLNTDTYTYPVSNTCTYIHLHSRYLNKIKLTSSPLQHGDCKGIHVAADEGEGARRLLSGRQEAT